MRLGHLFIALIFTIGLLAGCGSSDDGSGGASTSEAAADSSAFPVTINHKYGTTTIESKPERVVVAGLREQDALLAMGVVPVATTDWFGDHPGSIFPWAEDELGDAKVPVVLTQDDGVQIEKIAAQRPDLIIAVYSGMTKKEYESLSKFAPVVAMPKGKVDYGSSWQEETLMTGEAIGKPERAQELVDETEKLIADTAAKHPDFKGKSAAIITDYEGIFVYGPQDVRTTMLEQLGFKYPDGLRSAFPDEFGGQLSDEKVDELDVDALVWLADGERSVKELKEDPVYSKLGVRKEGRDVFIREDDRVYEATSMPSVLSMPLLMKELAPRLAAAVDGDPQTSTDQSRHREASLPLHAARLRRPGGLRIGFLPLGDGRIGRDEPGRVPGKGRAQVRYDDGAVEA
jgi:iron complex transport system substrate-binding protein